MKLRPVKTLLVVSVALSLWVFSDRKIPQQPSQREIVTPRSNVDEPVNVELTPLMPSPASISKVLRANSHSPLAKSASANNERVQSLFGKLPLYFIENQGQLDERVAYYLPGRMASVYFSSQGLTYALTADNKKRSTK